jgi:hypothetical protein
VEEKFVILIIDYFVSEKSITFGNKVRSFLYAGVNYKYEKTPFMMLRSLRTIARVEDQMKYQSQGTRALIKRPHPTFSHRQVVQLTEVMSIHSCSIPSITISS